jgi:hypothetical protein
VGWNVIRTTAVVLTLVTLWSATAYADEAGNGATTPVAGSVALAETTTLAPASALAAATPSAGILSIAPLAATKSSRRLALPVLDATFVALNVGDIASTVRALGRGGREANPVMGPIAGNTGALIAVKSASVTATLFASRKLSKKHPKAAALMMAGLNSAMALIVTHNARVAR